MKRSYSVLSVLMRQQYCGNIPTSTPAPTFWAAEVTGLGGVNDKSFNASGWKDIQDAMTTDSIDGKVLRVDQHDCISYKYSEENQSK